MKRAFPLNRPSDAARGAYATRAQAAALAYLVLPVGLFLGCFSSYLLAVLGLGFIGWAAWRISRNGFERGATSRPVAAALLGLACALAASSGILPPLWQNSDYPKHYGILKLLIESRRWPVVFDAGQGPETLRYYLGWYLVPAGLCRALGAGALNYVLAAWTALGLWLVFLLLAEQLKVKNRWLVVSAALMFMFFSGADQLGATLTGRIAAYPDHYEWWSGFYQFSSIMTSLVWAPQHGLAAWLAIGLLLGVGAESWIVTHGGLLFFATLFWSPLCAVGIVPFVLAAGWKSHFRQLLSVSNALSVLTLAAPLFGYLLSKTAAIPHKWIFQVPGWTVPNLVAFWLLEFGIFALIVAAIGTERKMEFGVAIGVLLLVPLFTLGFANDFSTRVSAAAIAMLAFVVVEVVVTKPWRQTIPLALPFVLGLGTPYAELSRSFRWANQGRMDSPLFVMRMDLSNPFREQYVAPFPNRFLRSVKRIAVLSSAPVQAEPTPKVAPPVRRTRHRKKK
ncbi:MAG: hypothetical protein ABI548_23290 [Polyangiaceae bacterium]